MSDIIFLQPASSIPADVEALAQHCKEHFMNHLRCNVIDEDLYPNEDNTVFTSKNPDWIAIPEPKIRTIDDNAVETMVFVGTDYTLSLEDGSITFSSAVTDIVRANYSYFPWGDEQVTEFVKSAITEIRVLIFRPIDENNIHADYRTAICRRTYTKLLEDLLGEAKNYYNISVAGRSVSKASVVSQINSVIDQNEKQLLQLIEALRHYNATNRILPTFSISKTISSDTEIS